MASGQRIVVIGGLAETEQVLKAVLEPRGLQVDHIRVRELNNERADSSPPSVVVLHGDECPSMQVKLQKWEDVPHVIIGSAEIAETDDGAANGQFLQKPFHYRELILAIERLLSELPPAKRAA